MTRFSHVQNLFSKKKTIRETCYFLESLWIVSAKRKIATSRIYRKIRLQISIRQTHTIKKLDVRCIENKFSCQWPLLLYIDVTSSPDTCVSSLFFIASITWQIHKSWYTRSRKTIWKWISTNSEKLSFVFVRYSILCTIISIGCMVRKLRRKRKANTSTFLSRQPTNKTLTAVLTYQMVSTLNMA